MILILLLPSPLDRPTLVRDMSSRGLTALGAAVVAGVASGRYSVVKPLLLTLQPRRTGPQDVPRDANTHHHTGVYTFGPMLQEQHKAQEQWKNPGYADTTLSLSSLMKLTSSLTLAHVVHQEQTLLPPTRVWKRKARRASRLGRVWKSENPSRGRSRMVQMSSMGSLP